MRITQPLGARLVFLVPRQRAMESGSSTAIYMMLSIIEYQDPAGVYNLTLDQIRGQFEREYRMTVTATWRRAAADFKSPSATELA
ncbi:hypothetical protein DFH09DRAFT_1334895 [Mycena vulgaris]|nr:hypothetical protein DFH09DRAFT_1334895 [Mycena vulgaris]